MVKLTTPRVNLGWKAEDFLLTGVENNKYSLNDIKGKNGTVIMFICNHCPYVKEIIDQTVNDIKKLRDHGVNAVAIMPNDTDSYPEDSFESMKEFAEKHNFCFPYLIDETQATAKAYDAVCTPDFFGFDEDLKLQYRGCVVNKNTGEHDLLNAMMEIVKNGVTNIKQTPSIGCSIKWRV